MKSKIFVATAFMFAVAVAVGLTRVSQPAIAVSVETTPTPESSLLATYDTVKDWSDTTVISRIKVDCNDPERAGCIECNGNKSVCCPIVDPTKDGPDVGCIIIDKVECTDGSGKKIPC